MMTRHHDRSSRLLVGSSNFTNDTAANTNTSAWPLLLAAYIIFGVLHELAHWSVASWLLLTSSSSSSLSSSPTNYHYHDHGTTTTTTSSSLLLGNIARAILGRYSLVPVEINDMVGGGRSSSSDSRSDSYYYDDSHYLEDTLHKRISIILHAGWIFSVVLAVGCHLLHWYARNYHYCSSIHCSQQQHHHHQKQQVRLLLGGGGGVHTFLIERLMVLFHSPILPIAAYITAMEAISTDLFGFIPANYHNHPPSEHPHLQYHHLDYIDDDGNHHHRLLLLRCFCGNFGILLLNPSWLAIDGGRTALDVLEKMITVTMMRGAQSGGVVTFEPDRHQPPPSTNNNNKTSSSSSITPPSPPPSLHGIRSRVVNAKRTDLSKGVRRQVMKDNCERFTGNLRGWKKAATAAITANGYNHNSTNTRDGGGGGSTTTATSSGSYLVKGFYGHTRFATSSKASFDGTHPHQWSPRRMYSVYPFASSSSSAATSSLSRSVGVENYITHNGDFEFFHVNGKFSDVEVVQQWLEKVLDVPMPATVDSAAIAGVIDLLRTQGSFALSARYALCLTLRNSKVESDPAVSYPTVEEYEEIAKTFEKELDGMLESIGSNAAKHTLEEISSSEEKRTQLASVVVNALRGMLEVLATSIEVPTTRLGESSSRRKRGGGVHRLLKFISIDEEDAELEHFVRSTIDAFFDNDLLHSTRLFLQNAKGSFGLMIASSLDAHRQTCFAARGQTLSIAFYPRKDLICYGSEQAAVKAGLNYENPEGSVGRWSVREEDNAVRLDLDDLGGEICLLDWGYAGDVAPAISPPNRSLVVDKAMNGRVNVVLLHQNNISKPLSKRLTLLENNEFIRPLLDDYDDLVLADIRDIPRVCKQIQDDWRDVGLNRMTAWNLANCIRARMKARVDGKISSHGGTVDILVTGCEVSLWVAEQFVADLEKCFPKLFVKAISSNKILGLFGQELAMPCIGFPYSQESMDLNDPIIIIVSHSGGTFGPLACSNLLQSFSSSIFAVTSEWDTQIGKQLRSMYSDDLLSSRIFTTEVGVRPAEPCSVSVVATHQLLTNIFGHICVTIISDPHFSRAAGAVVRERDLQILERCNQEGLKTLEEIVGVDVKGDEVHDVRRKTERELRSAGDLWANHILEVAKAYIMSFIYIVGTVTSGFPLISGLAKAFGLTGSEGAFYFIRFLDALIYFWLPQINIAILRLIEKRNLRHRMVGRTVVIGDCPWVAQSADAFLSKIFACSYSIAGLTVLSGNPADHLVHRHTHRVVRGSLLVCGRPDGRLPALTSLEASTCLSVNQASSIQSLGGTCESITIGHNKSKLPLSHRAIFLKPNRPLFLSEKILDTIDHQEDLVRQRNEKMKKEKHDRQSRRVTISRTVSYLMNSASLDGSILELSLSRSRKAKITRSSASLMGAYVNLEREARKKRNENIHQEEPLSNVVNAMVKKVQGVENIRRVFNEIDLNNDGVVSLDEFIAAYQKIDADLSVDHLKHMFEEADVNDNGELSFEDFLRISRMPSLLADLGTKNRDSRGLVQVQASKEKYFGEEIRKHATPGVDSMAMSQSQNFSMELYESRIASLQRFVAMTVMFHQMGYRVQTFFPKVSFGLLGYRMDRTHSIMRIATTASPVSGADVRERMEELRLMLKIERSVQLIMRTWKNWKLKNRQRSSIQLTNNNERLTI